MRTATKFTWILLLSFFAVSCTDNMGKDKVETVTLYVSAETGTYRPWGSDADIECMLVSETPGKDYNEKLALSEIEGFTHEKGYEWVLKVRKTTLANPPQDTGDAVYALIRVVSKTAVGND